MFRKRKNPFKPGAGLPPPFRAGHEEAAGVLGGRLQDICDRDGGDIVVLYGPRGNGKTVLLREIERKAKRKGVTVRVLFDGVMQGGDEKVARYLKTGLAEPKQKVKAFGAGALSAKGNIEFEGVDVSETAQALHTLLEKKPVLLVIDEAHVMPIGFGRGILQVAQLLIGQGMPLLMVLAGTPGLRSHLGRMGATFWERCKRLRIGRLESDDAARDALAIPAKRTGLVFEDKALDLIVEESQRYPFFLQLLGEAVWNVTFARKGAKAITLEDARASVAKANSEKLEFYAVRFREADDHDILAAAIAVSRKMLALEEGAALSDADLMETLKAATAGTGTSPKAARDTLTRLGFIWDNENLKWEPGIPSLCAYFVEKSDNP